MFSSVEALLEDIDTHRHRKYCFAFAMSKVTPQIPEVNVTVFFPRDSIGGIINTYTPLYDLSLRNPDWGHYNKTMGHGTPQFMIAMADFIVMMMRGYRMKEIEIAFVPMKTPEFKQLPPSAAEQLKNTFPQFFISIFLLPLYYLVTRLAEEKESKAREGMKMMGLNDRTYYLGWFLFNACIVIYTSAIIVSLLQIEIFENSNAWLMLAMCSVYGCQLFGFSFTLVALLPSKKASATAASILHLSTYWVVHLYKGFGTSFTEKLVVSSICPNVAVGFMIEHLLHLEIDGGIGLDMESAAMPYQEFSFFIALACQVLCCFVWALLGMYFDKIMPREFGRAEPWNFLCKRKA